MATVSKDLAEQIIRLDGYYMDDPRVLQVVKYTNKWGGESYAILYEQDVLIDRYQPSEFVINPEIIWKAQDADL